MTRKEVLNLKTNLWLAALELTLIERRGQIKPTHLVPIPKADYYVVLLALRSRAFIFLLMDHLYLLSSFTPILLIVWTNYLSQ